MNKQKHGKLKECTVIAIMGLILGSMLWLPIILYIMGYGV